MRSPLLCLVLVATTVSVTANEVKKLPVDKDVAFEQIKVGQVPGNDVRQFNGQSGITDNGYKKTVSYALVSVMKHHPHLVGSNKPISCTKDVGVPPSDTFKDIRPYTQVFVVDHTMDKNIVESIRELFIAASCLFPEKDSKINIGLLQIKGDKQSDLQVYKDVDSFIQAVAKADESDGSPVTTKSMSACDRSTLIANNFADRMGEWKDMVMPVRVMSIVDSRSKYSAAKLVDAGCDPSHAMGKAAFANGLNITEVLFDAVNIGGKNSDNGGLQQLVDPIATVQSVDDTGDLLQQLDDWAKRLKNDDAWRHMGIESVVKEDQPEETKPPSTSPPSPSTQKAIGNDPIVVKVNPWNDTTAASNSPTQKPTTTQDHSSTTRRRAMLRAMNIVEQQTKTPPDNTSSSTTMTSSTEPTSPSTETMSSEATFHQSSAVPNNETTTIVGPKWPESWFGKDRVLIIVLIIIAILFCLVLLLVFCVVCCNFMEKKRVRRLADRGGEGTGLTATCSVSELKSDSSRSNNKPLVLHNPSKETEEKKPGHQGVVEKQLMPDPFSPVDYGVLSVKVNSELDMTATEISTPNPKRNLQTDADGSPLLPKNVPQLNIDDV